MAKFNKDWSLQEKVAFVHGYAYAQAESMQKEGVFKELEVNEVVKFLIKEVIKHGI